MRSRPDVSVFLDPPMVHPGRRLRVRVRLESRGDTPFDGVEVVLAGTEVRYKNNVSTGKSSVAYYHRREVCRLIAKFPPGRFEPGAWERYVDFDIPADAPPTYRSRLTTIDYVLKVHVDIPWWPDRTVKYSIPVALEPSDEQAAHPQTFTSQVGDYRGEDPVVELSVEHDHLVLDGTLRGAVAVTGIGSKRVRRVELVSATRESPRVYSAVGPTDVDRRQWVVRDGRPTDGEAIPFNLRVPSDLAVPFVSPYITVDHWLEARVVVAFGKDVVLRAPVRVLRAAGRTPRGDATPAALLVGRDRQRAVWVAASERARSAGFESIQFDPERERATFSVRGIDVTLAEELREELGPSLVATLEYPALGLGLRVAERRWTDFGAAPEGLHRGLLKRFAVRVRDPRQVKGVLDDGLFRALSSFDEAALDDDTAVVVRKGGVNQLSGLERVLAATRDLAEMLASRIEAIQPPEPLASVLPAWKRFAEDHGARLRVGDGSVQSWAVRGVPLTVEYAWHHANPQALRLSTRVPDGADGDAWRARLGEELSLEAFLERGFVGVTLPLDSTPERVAALAERMSACISKLLGVSVEGPYR